MENQEFVNSLRQLADFYEKHPEVPLPDTVRMPIYSLNTKEEIEPVARAFGNAFKRVDDNFFKLVRRFGVIDLEVIAYREKVCTKRVVGKKKELQKVYPKNIGYTE